MATYKVIFYVNELVLDSNGHCMGEYIANLPHEAEIADSALEDWNKMQYWMTGLINALLERDFIESCYLTGVRDTQGKLELAINFKAVNGARWTQKYKRYINDFVSDQLSEGWGKGFFSLYNLHQNPDGTQWCPVL